MSRNIISLTRILLLIAVMEFVSCSSVMAVENYSQSNKTYYITQVISNKQIKLGANSKLIFKGGSFRNCTLVGNNTVVVPDGESVIFSHCTFKGTFADSKVYATNFGCVNDMKSKSYSWKFKKRKAQNTKLRYGTDNKTALDAVAAFCSGSKNVSVNFNGQFYTPVVDNRPGKSEGNSNKMVISNASGLELYGGSLIQGLYLVDAQNVKIHDMRFLGQHEVHDFPPLYSSSDIFNKSNTHARVKKLGLSQDLCYNISNDQYNACGLAPEAIYFVATTKGECSNMLVENCHAEMRMSGIVAGARREKTNVKKLTIKNCTFSHIYWQPIGLHSSEIIVDGIEADYCMQGVDMSNGANRAVIKNSRFMNCFTGPKQQTYNNVSGAPDWTYGNVMENCYYQINSTVEYVDSEPYLFYASQAANEDYCELRNMTFDVNTNRRTSGFISLAYGLKITDLKLNLTVNSQESNYDILRLTAPQGSLVNAKYTTPQIIINGAQINLNARVAYFATNSGSQLNLQLKDVVVNGSGQFTYPCFNTLTLVSIDKMQMNVPCKGLFERCKECNVNALNALNVSGVLYSSASVDAKSVSFTMKNSAIKTTADAFKLDNAITHKINVSQNQISCANLVNFRKVGDLQLSITNNRILSSSPQLITGMANLSTSQLKSNKFTVTGNVFDGTRQAVVCDRAYLNKYSSLFKNNQATSKVSIK
ncbi:MAG: hypothetical protein IJ808_02750 [Muribaculaceae bacterium]|nr:hypothetical protein [Muribaculaceae bacterium]